jgi:hypothetical protein
VTWDSRRTYEREKRDVIFTSSSFPSPPSRVARTPSRTYLGPGRCCRSADCTRGSDRRWSSKSRSLRSRWRSKRTRTPRRARDAVARRGPQPARAYVCAIAQQRAYARARPAPPPPFRRPPHLRHRRRRRRRRRCCRRRCRPRSRRPRGSYRRHRHHRHRRCRPPGSRSPPWPGGSCRHHRHRWRRPGGPASALRRQPRAGRRAGRRSQRAQSPARTFGPRYTASTAKSAPRPRLAWAPASPTASSGRTAPPSPPPRR